MSLRNAYTIALVIISSALASSCGSSSPTSPTTSADVTITIQGDRGNQSYSPPAATMTAGQTVAWHNGDSTAHTATQDSGQFNTGTLGGGSNSAPVTMSTRGTFTYHCSIHPGMVATITVQ
jgi:plastocyanin